jgi:TolA-binding protein
MTLKAVFINDHTDDKSLQFIISALKKSNLEGFDYLEFIQAVERLKSMPMEEGLAFRSAYSTVNTVGLTKEKLLESANYYLDVLEKEQRVFEQTVEDRRLIKIERQKNRIRALEEEVKKLSERIDDMKKKISQYQKEQENIRITLDSENEKINLTEKTFETTISSVIDRIEKDIELIRTNIK